MLQVVRGGQLVTPVPTVVTRLRGPPRPWAHTRLLDQGGSSFVLPGPATIMDGVYNNHYQQIEHMRADIGTYFVHTMMGSDFFLKNKDIFQTYTVRKVM